MIRMLENKQILTLSNTNLTCMIKQFIGGGGQGEVYQASVGNNDVALKWYYPQQATEEQKSAIEDLIRIGPPSDKFLWPANIVIADNSFGYIMPLRSMEFKNLVDLMKQRISPTFKAIVTACIELSHSFYQLHSKGLCYRDISFGNVFFEPRNGNILICDNDNVSVNGKTMSGILGTPRFMAPEVVIGKALPSTKTDLFSLAVLLFYMLMVHHPLEGEKENQIKCFDLPAMNKLYGEEPIFIFDPDNDSNRPTAAHQANASIYWNIYPQFLQNLFIKAFTTGIHDPNNRVRETEWRKNLVKLRDSIFYCSNCGNENFFDETDASTNNLCWSCKSQLSSPLTVMIENSLIILNHDTQLFPHHLDNQKPYDFSQPLAEVTQHPQNPKIWGLKNLSNTKWVTTTSEKQLIDVLPGKSVSITIEKEVNFGNKKGVFK